MDSFYEKVYDIVAKIPFGKVVTYGQIAWMLGKPRNARQVGFAMHHCPDDLPWHRVVMADGTITGGQFSELRKLMLQNEKVSFLPNGKVDVKLCRWKGE